MCVCLKTRLLKALHTMALSHHEYQTLSSYLNLDEEVDYGSDTSVDEEEGIMTNTPMPEARPH